MKYGKLLRSDAVARRVKSASVRACDVCLYLALSLGLRLQNSLHPLWLRRLSSSLGSGFPLQSTLAAALFWATGDRKWEIVINVSTNDFRGGIRFVSGPAEPI